MDDRDRHTRFAAARVGRLATVTAQGEPRAVPCCFAVSGDTVYTAVDAKPKSTRALQRLTNIARNPSASLIVDHYDDDWAQLWWVRADGTARVLGDEAEIAHAISLLRAKYAQYDTVAIDGPVIAIDVTRWRSWAYT